MQHKKTSASCRVAIIYTQPSKEPEILLILEKPSSAVQKDGSIKIFEKIWKMPGGKKEPNEDNDLYDCVIRETLQEAGIFLDREKLSLSMPYITSKVSRRPGSDFHEMITFLYITEERLKGLPGEEKIKKVMWFPFSKIPAKVKFYRKLLADSNQRYLKNLVEEASSQKQLRKAGISNEDIEKLLEILAP